MKSTYFISLVLFSCLLALAETEQTDSSSSLSAPKVELNPAGKRRLEENRQILSKNIETSLGNAQNSSKNAKTLASEIQSLKSIESELVELKSQYQSFLNRAKSETERNEKAMQRLRVTASSSRTATEMDQRILWKKDTDSKVQKVSSLLGTLNQNLTKIQKKVTELEEKKIQWLDREKVHEKLADEFSQKKLETEKKLRGES